MLPSTWAPPTPGPPRTCTGTGVPRSPRGGSRGGARSGRNEDRASQPRRRTRLSNTKIKKIIRNCVFQKKKDLALSITWPDACPVDAGRVFLVEIAHRL